LMMKQAVRQRATDALVEEDEYGGHPGSLFPKALSILPWAQKSPDLKPPIQFQGQSRRTTSAVITSFVS
jgi:hypothetical protein